MRIAFAGDLGLTSRLLPDPGSRIAPEVSRLLRSCDLAVVNLELPLRPEGASVAPYSHPSLTGRHEAWPLVAKAGFRALSMASNHCMDSGRKGIAFTRYMAARDGIAVFGAGLDEADARTPAFVEVAGRRVGLIGYCKKGPFTASGLRAGAALLSRASLQADIPVLRMNCDVLVVSIHAGMEFMEEIHPDVAGFARLAVDLGADCVVGHHPHVAQPAEIYRGKPIFYSLGNFLFDNRAGASSCDVQWSRRHRGLVATVAFGEGIEPSFELFPVEYDPDGLTVRLAAAPPDYSCSSDSVAASGDEADCRGLGRIARREISTIIALTRLHGPSFPASLAADMRPRHLRMLWNLVFGTKDSRR